MARVSFTVRSTSASGGSYLQYPDGSASPGLFPTRGTDSALHGAGVAIVPSTQPTVSVFSGVPITYGSIKLNWATTVSTVAGLTPSVTSLLLVYSARGVPQTVLSGKVLIDSGSTFSYTHTGLQQGAWAYYSLFAHYTTSDSSSDYFYKLAELEVLVPNDYGSTLRLWEQLPAAARLADSAQGNYNFSRDIGITSLNALGFTFDTSGNLLTSGDPVGPMLKYLSIIGFDIDGLRTLMDYIMVSKDPEIANTETLNALASTMGLDITTSNLGDSRLRDVLNNIGTFRRSKGTLSAAILFLNAVTGCNVTLNSTTRKFTIYSQRANYVTAPRDGAGITTWRVANAVEVTAPQSFSYTGYNAASAGGSDVTLSGQTWTRSTAAHNIIGAMIKLSSPVPVLLNDFAMFSVHSSTPKQILWARLVTAGGLVTGWGQVVKNISNVSYIEIPITANANSTTFTNCTLEFLVDLSVGPFVGANYLTEVNYLGDYFDGGTTRGGWIVDNVGSVNDFRWLGSVNNSVSVYAEDFSRTVGVVKDVLAQVLPITVESLYAVTAYAAVRGF